MKSNSVKPVAKSNSVKQPVVKLVGVNGNAFLVMGLCLRAAKQAGWSDARLATLTADLKAGDYDHMLQVALREFDVR